VDDIDIFLKEFEGYLRVDQNDLDNAVIEHPELYWRICYQYKMAISDRDGAKDQLKQTDGNLYLAHKEALETAGEKSTEARIAALVESDVEHQDALSDYRRLALNVELLESLKAAFEQRSYALKELVELYCVNYAMNSAITKKETTMVRDHAAEEARAELSRARKPLTRTRKTS